MFNPPNRRGTDPYARWCGRGGIARRPPIPIEVVVPTRQHWTKRLTSSVFVLTVRMPTSLPDPSFSSRSIKRFGRNIALGVRRRHVPNAVR